MYPAGWRRQAGVLGSGVCSGPWGEVTGGRGGTDGRLVEAPGELGQGQEALSGWCGSERCPAPH